MPPSANSVLLQCGRNEGATLYKLKVFVLHYQEYLLQQDLLLGSRRSELCAAQSLIFLVWKAVLAVVAVVGPPLASAKGPSSWLLERPHAMLLIVEEVSSLVLFQTLQIFSDVNSDHASLCRGVTDFIMESTIDKT